MHENNEQRFGIVGGLGTLGAADILFKLVKAMPAENGQDQTEIIFEQHPFKEPESPGSQAASQNSRKLYVFDMLRAFEARKLGAAILPCFISHTFLDELRSEIQLPIVSIMDAICKHVARRHAGVRRIGVLTSDYVRSRKLFERHFQANNWELVYPSDGIQANCLMAAIYGASGLKGGNVQGQSVDLLARACEDLLAQGAEIIVPGFAEIPLVIDALVERKIPILDSNQIYARFAASAQATPPLGQFKIGVVGGVGPAATVDFMGKIVRNTPAKLDQDHVKILVEHNPQIPDRTENLIGDGADPTIAIYSTCKKLEAGDANIIAIPCNTAHAFVERVQPYLSIPIVNMLFETVAYIKATYPEVHTVGLLATDGTIKSNVYGDMLSDAGLNLLVPDALNQQLVMHAIYGAQGVKAGFVEGECKLDLLKALSSLAQRGAAVIILGCTELPLLLEQSEAFPIGEQTVVVLDPTDILAKKCVSLCTSHFNPCAATANSP